MKKAILISSFALALVALLLYACKKIEKKESNNKHIITLENSSDYQSFLVAEQNRIPVSFFEKKSFRDNGYSIKATHSLVKKNTFNDFINTLMQNVKGDIHDIASPVAIVLYLNQFQENIETNEIKGISIFDQNENKLEHRFFQTDKNLNTHENMKLRTTFSGFSTADFDILSDFSQKIDSKNPAFYVFLFTSDFLTIRKEQMGTVPLTRVVIEVTGSARVASKGGCLGCNGENGECEREPEGTIRCEPDCFKTQIDDAANEFDIKVNIDKTFPEKPAHEFRDNFLSKYKKGQDYIDYYYKMAIFSRSFKTIKLDNFYQHYSFGKNLYEVAFKLQHGNNQDIIITKKFKNDADALLNYYSKITANQELVSIFNNIRNDVAKFEGKTREQIMQELE